MPLYSPSPSLEALLLCTAKLHKACAINLVLAEGFNNILNKNISANFTVTHSHETQIYLSWIFLLMLADFSAIDQRYSFRQSFFNSNILTNLDFVKVLIEALFSIKYIINENIKNM